MTLNAILVREGFQRSTVSTVQDITYCTNTSHSLSTTGNNGYTFQKLAYRLKLISGKDSALLCGPPP